MTSPFFRFNLPGAGGEFPSLFWTQAFSRNTSSTSATSTDAVSSAYDDASFDSSLALNEKERDWFSPVTTVNIPVLDGLVAKDLLAHGGLPVESTIATGPESEQTTRDRSISLLLSLQDDALIAVLGTLSPEVLKRAATVCKTLCRLSRNSVTLTASLHRILPDVQFVTSPFLKPDRQFRIICERLYGPLLKMERIKKIFLARLQVLRGSAGNDGFIDAAWQRYKTQCDSLTLPAHTFDQVFHLQTQNPGQNLFDPRVYDSLSRYMQAHQEFVSIAGGDYTGAESSIDPKSGLGMLEAKTESIRVEFNDQDFIEELIRTKEQQANQ